MAENNPVENKEIEKNTRPERPAPHVSDGRQTPLCPVGQQIPGKRSPKPGEQSPKPDERLLKPIKIGNVSTKNAVFMAPLAGYTDVSFRKTARRLGAGLTFTEMVSCKGLYYGNEKTGDLLTTGEEEAPSAAQIFGCDPEIMLQACLLPEMEKFDIIDVNMGCPVPKLYKNGEGSALLESPEIAERIVKNLQKTGKPITVKFRIGTKQSGVIAAEFAKRMEGAGAALLTVHGRLREAYYAGEPDFAAIRAAAEAVKIPVVANGGVFSLSSAKKILDETGAAGVMVARGAMFDPLLLCDLTGTLRPKMADVVLFLITDRQNRVEKAASSEEEFLRLQTAFVADFRKQFAAFLRGVRGGKRVKEQIFRAETFAELSVLARAVNWEDRAESGSFDLI